MRIGSSATELLIVAHQARRGAPGVLDEQVDQLCLSSQDRADSARSSYKQEMTRNCLVRGAIGGVAGYALLSQAYQMPHAELLGPLLGAGVGLYTAWEGLHREQTGKVSVQLDDKTYTKKFVGSGDRVALTPEEARFQLIGSGVPDPSQIKPMSAQQIPEPTAEQLAPWKEQAGQLKQLGEQRRLVASFGQVTADYQPIVHLVDSVNAAKLAACGKTVYAVEAQEPKDVTHTMSMTGFNVKHSKATSEQFKYHERTVDYTLIPLTNPSQLALVKPAQGVPESMFGLLEKSNAYAEIVNVGQSHADSETDSPEFGTRATVHKDSYYFSSQQRLPKAMDLESGIRTVQHVNLPALLGLVGTTAGLITAMCFTGPGVPGPALIGATLGFLSGRAAGRAIIERN